MKVARAAAVVVVTSCVALSACRLPHIPGLSNSAKAPTGQVVATVDGKEITFLQLQAELAGLNASDPKVRKAAEQRALQIVIARTALAEAARKQGLDKTPDFALQQKRAIDGLLVQLLQTKLINAVPPPSAEEAQRFITDHPDDFAQRKIFAVDVIRMARPSNPNTIKDLEPMTSLAQVETYLTANRLAHDRTTGNIDAVGTNPQLIAQLVKLPPNEVFIYAANGALLVNQIRDVKVEPFGGDAATKYALALLQHERTQEAVTRQLRQIIAAAGPTVRYNDAYKPAPPPVQPAPAAPAAKPAA